ncbi:hypothetical protein LJC20_02745 [Eubacteriales bacterium OttesenSCG-928-M02]|nr:hypothetical protein [Eubacteriales bacterium OttesenSCG-928-M02]
MQHHQKETASSRREVLIKYPMSFRLAGLIYVTIAMSGFFMFFLGWHDVSLPLRMILCTLFLAVAVFNCAVSMNQMNWRVRAYEDHIVTRDWTMREKTYLYEDLKEIIDPYEELTGDILADRIIVRNTNRAAMQRYELIFEDSKVVIPLIFGKIEELLQCLIAYAQDAEGGPSVTRMEAIYENYQKAEAIRKDRKNGTSFFR